MWQRNLVVLAALFSTVPTAHAQGKKSASGMDQSGNVTVHVVYADEHPAGYHLRVQMMSGGNTPMTEGITDDRGVATFVRVPSGVYHVVVSGQDIEDVDSGAFEVDPRKVSQDLYVTVHSKTLDSQQTVSGPQSVAAVDLNIPNGAKKEFDKASRAMASQDWAKAVERLKRAISIYPQYAPAYNNLGVVYGHMNDPVQERAALEKAISLNDHFVPAYVNLAKLSLREHGNARAEILLETALRVEAANVETMTLFAQAQLLNKHYDAAIETARQVHALAHQNYAVVHYIAARAAERLNQPQVAAVELKIFLTEEPTGPRADHVREEMAQMKDGQP